MILPEFALLDLYEGDLRVRWSARNVHPNGSFYKYYWWVFWRGSACEGLEFLSPAYRLPLKQAFDLMERLDAEAEPYCVYNQRLPRRHSRLDPCAERWHLDEWAPSYEDDPDEPYQGHK